jgi:putative transposase
MTREARAVVIGVPHHITQRGNNRQDVFFVDDDCRFYLDTLRAKSEQYGLIVHAFCLMTNHAHIVATPTRDDSLAKAVGRTHYFFTRYVNKLHSRSGHLWQNRFFSCPLDEFHFLNCVRYVERNPVRARMVRVATRYPWSSAAAHVAGNDAMGLLSFDEWPRRFKGERWRKELQSAEDGDWLGAIRNATFKGHALGSDFFIGKIETRIGRRLRPAPVGRPKKKATAKHRAKRRRK